MPATGAPTTRLADTPASPPNHSGSISAAAATSSATPRVIIANAVPRCRVLGQPSSAAASAPAAAPASGTRLTGQPAGAAWFSAQAAAYAPRPR